MLKQNLLLAWSVLDCVVCNCICGAAYCSSVEIMKGYFLLVLSGWDRSRLLLDLLGDLLLLYWHVESELYGISKSESCKSQRR